MSSKRNAKLLKAVLSAAPFACGFMAMPAGAQNMTYAFTPAPGTFAWSSGTGWTPSAPASGINTALLFTDNATSFASGLNTTSVNDLAGFQLNELDLTGTGPAAAPTAVINITGNDLTFVNNGTSDPIINLLAANGSQGLTYNVSNNLTLNNNLTVQGGASATYNFTGNIVGTAGLTKMNGSTLVLKGTNTYAGSTTISGGTLRATQASALDGFNSVGSVTVNSAATLSVVGGGNGWSSAQIDTLLASAIFTTGSNFAIHVDPSNSFSYGSNISQPTGFVKSGNGILTLSGNNTFTGGATLSGGQLNVNSATALGGGPFTVAAAGSIDNTTSGAITLTNNNAITLNNNLTFVGTKDLNFGPTSVVTFNAPRTIIVRGGTLSVGSLSNAGSASGSLTKQGGGTLAVTGNTAAGAYIDTTVSGGVLAMGSVSLLGSGDLTLSGGDLNISSAAGAGRAISSGPLIDGSGRDTITLAPAAGGSVTLTASSLGNRGNYATELYRGTNLGTAAPGANVSNIFFTSAPTVNQGGGGTFSGANSFAAVDGVGALNGPGAAVLRGALIDTTATGNGTSFATYDSTVGIRALKPSEQISTVTTNDNVRLNLAAGTTSFVGAVLNTLQLDNTSGSAAVATFSGAAGSFAPANGILFTGSSPITLSTQNVLTFGTGISTPNDVVILSTNSAGATVGNMMVATVAFNRGYTLGGPGLLTVGGLGGVATNGAVTITGPGTVTFNGATSTSSGGIVVAGGTLKLGSSFSISNTNSQRDFAVGAGATFDLNGFTMTAGNAYEALDNFNGAGGIVTNSSANAATLTLSHFQDIGTNRTFSGNITGNLNFVLNTIAGVTGTQTLANTSSYTGFTTVSSGTLVLGINNALPGTTTLSVNGGGTTSAVLEMGGFSQLVDTLSGTIAAGATGIGTIQNGSVNTTSTLTIGGSGVGTFAGAIVDNQGVGGTVAVVRSGTGETNLDGTGSYTGGTTVSGGLFRVNGLLSSAANSVTVNGGTLGGKGTITGPVAVTSSGHIAPGAGVGTLTLKSTLSLASGSHLDYELVAPGNNDVIDVSNASNAFTLNGGVFNLLTPGGVTPFSDPGTYQLIKFAGAIQGTGLDSSWTTVSPTNAHVLDPQLFKSYAFGSSGGFLTLTINSTTTTGTWTGSASNSWGSGATNANWNNSVTPGAPGDT
ncbi:MAG TPA: autotransporter-associated beta strand repeat-containing protein, partial [Tepidisphaeraceae bacterium]|nr:autotransporter-associated beta strand repeat-containing protein [Tepidisphaeraceae bacterium]